MSDVVQATFDYGVLDQEQAQRTQDAEIRIIGRTQKAIIDNGKDLLAVKTDIGHGHFLNWVQSIGISADTAQRWMGVAESFREIPQSAVFDKTALYLLSKAPESARDEAKQRAELGEKITEEIARQIRDAHKAREEAIAREQTAQAQLRLFEDQEQSRRSEITHLSMQIKDLERQLAEQSTQNSIPPEVTARLEKLQRDIKERTRERDNLAEVREEQRKALEEYRNANRAVREQELHEARVKQNLQQITDTFQRAVAALLSQFPSVFDTQVFDHTDWSRLDHAIEVVQRFLVECEQLRTRPTALIIDAR
jgi:hypothetical protein